MKNSVPKSFALLAAGLLISLAVHCQAAIVQTSQSSGNTSADFDGSIAVNLLQNGQSSLGSVMASSSSISGVFSASGLNDGLGLGSGNSSATYYAVASGQGTIMPATVTFNLTAGYNLTNIEVISGWGDHNLGEQTFQVLLSTNGGAFFNYGTFTNNTSVNTGFSGPGSWMTTLTDSSGTMATNVTAIQFVFLNPDTNNGVGSVGPSQSGDGSVGGTVIHEIQAFGTFYANLNTNSTTIVATYLTNGTSSSYFDSFVAPNLILAGQTSLASATADPSSLNGTFSAAGLNDGSAAGNGNLTYYAVSPGSGSIMPNTAVFQLTAGYNITNIQVISGWSDHNLGEQSFQVLVSIAGGTFTNLGTFGNNASIPDPGSWMTTITSTTGTIATNVTAVEFVFSNPDQGNGIGSVGNSQAGSSGGTVIHELQVFGTYYTNLVQHFPPVLIHVTDSNILSGLTPDDWVCKTNYIDSAVCGAAVTVGFTNTSQVAVQVVTSQFTNVVASRYPILAWSVNGGPYQSHQLSATDTAIMLATNTVNPVIDLYIEGMSPFEDRYDGNVPTNCVEITGFLVGTNGATTPVAHPAKVWLNIGDSIMSGDEALYTAGQGRPADDDWAASDDGRASYGYLLARHYGYQESRLAYGGYDWGGGLAYIPALTTLIDHTTSTVSRLTNGVLNTIPDVVLINLGENGAPALSDVTNALFKLRSRVHPATKIIVMIPVAGTSQTEVTLGYSSYTNSTSDPNTFLVNLGSISYPTGDGQHPTALGHEMIYQAALPSFDAIINPTITESVQYADSSSAFDGYIVPNLIQAGQSSLAGVTASHGPSIPGTFTTAGLNDGSTAANANLTYYGFNDTTGGNLPVTLTFNLNTNIAIGYNITGVQVITGWSDSDLANQEFQLLFSRNGGPFVSAGVFLNTTNTVTENGGNNAIMDTLTNLTGGPIASSVTGVQLVFQNPPAVQEGSGGVLIRELQVFGTPIVNLSIQPAAGNNVTLSWPQGTLLQATTLAGPWTPTGATSPYTVSPSSGARMFYRILVQ